MGDDDLALSQTHQRLNRVDRVFDMLGEQQLTIQNQVGLHIPLICVPHGVSGIDSWLVGWLVLQDVAIQALEERLQTMEDSNRYDFGTLQVRLHGICCIHRFYSN